MQTTTNQPTLTYPYNGHENFTRVDVGPFTLWWSYADLVAFQTPDAKCPYVIDDYEFSMTTQRHIRWMKSEPHYPLNHDAFQAALAGLIDRWTREASH